MMCQAKLWHDFWRNVVPLLGTDAVGKPATKLDLNWPRISPWCATTPAGDPGPDAIKANMDDPF